MILTKRPKPVNTRTEIHMLTDIYLPSGFKSMKKGHNYMVLPENVRRGKVRIDSGILKEGLHYEVVPPRVS